MRKDAVIEKGYLQGKYGEIALIGLNANAVIQGILVTGAAVCANKLIKQNSKQE